MEFQMTNSHFQSNGMSTLITLLRSPSYGWSDALAVDCSTAEKAADEIELLTAECAFLKARIEELESRTPLVTFNEACKRIDILEAALRFIADGYDNHDVNHVDYRVKVYQVALDALSDPALPQSSTPAVTG